MGKTLYLECTSGISGDMTVAALLDLGASEERLRAQLATLPTADEFEVVVSRVEKNGLAACDFDVRLDAAHENHDHDMAYLYGHLHGEEPEGHKHGHHHEREHEGEGENCHLHVDEHCHEHHHAHDHEHGHAHHHEHRSLADVTGIINASQLTAHAKELALAIFAKLADGEAAAHGATRETVHFHEVGATDSIVDICSVAICLDDLGVTDVVVPALTEGAGTVRCAHGIMPVPVPAVANICRQNGIALERTQVAGELVTPTGAAIVAALRTTAELPERYTVSAMGTGAGKRTYHGCSEVLRAMLIEPARGHARNLAHEPASAEPSGLPTYKLSFATETPRHVVKLESDLDDCTGEALGLVISKLVEAGAREAHATPVVMKKGRPGWQLEVVCDESLVDALERIIFEDTTTIGIRSTTMRRDALPRRTGSKDTPYGLVATKIVALPSGAERTYPEHDSVLAASAGTGTPYQDVFRATLS